MPRPAKRSATARRKVHRLQSGSASLFDEAEPDFSPPQPLPERSRLVVPTWLLNSAIAVFLLPLAVIWSETFFTIFSCETVDHSYWATEEFWFFALGAILWLIVFYSFRHRKIVYLYVLGHELTHAVWVWLMGGRVIDRSIRCDGGYIVTNKSNVWIALSPYFYPIYSVLVVILYALGWLFWDMAPYTCWLFLALGVTWTFHISFTLWMIPKGQSDLTQHGTFFSLVVIYLMNLALLTGLLLLTAPHATLGGFAHEFLHHAADFSGWVVSLIRK